MKTANPESAIRVLKSASCPSLSGKSKLTYHIGCTAKSEIHFRVYANSSTGYFSNEWLALSAIQQLLAKAPKDGAITSFVLTPLLQGKSINTPAFLFAALQNEELVCPSKITRRCYDRVDPKAFMAKVKALIASPVNLAAEGKARKAEDAHKGENKHKPAATGKKSPAKPIAKK